MGRTLGAEGPLNFIPSDRFRQPMTSNVRHCMNFPEPWYVPHNPTSLEEQLQRELPPGHSLFGIPVRAIAQRVDCDDVLFQLVDGSDRVAVVHLTFSISSDPTWPATTFFPSLAVFRSSQMQQDHTEYNA
jgi:hypothetical protein